MPGAENGSEYFFVGRTQGIARGTKRKFNKE
jgi:hypothetical protein